MRLPLYLGDDATGDPNITTDDSGMSVVTITASQTSWPWWVWLALAGGAWYLWERK